MPAGVPEYMPDPEEYRHEKHTAALKKLREEALTPFKPPSKPKKLVMGTSRYVQNQSRRRKVMCNRVRR